MKEKALTVPAWLKSGAVYQINLRTFSDKGTINALCEELPFLKKLGFKTLYFCPVFEEDDSDDKAFWSKRQLASQTENSKNPYRISNYFKIDSEYGSMDDLYTLVRQAHALDMKVLLDLVYMHCAPHAPFIHMHPEFVAHDEKGEPKYTIYHFPLLNFDSAGLREYLWSNMTYFVGELDVDGFRCDVGDAVPNDFWVEGRRRMQAIKPDAVLIDEGFDFARMSSSFDSCYAVNWHEDLYKVFSGALTARQMMQNERELQKNLPGNGLLLRDMDNHDTVTDWPVRSETLAGHDGMELILALNYTFAGIPMVYCGNELADESKISMFANRFHMGAFCATDRAALKTTEAGRRRQAVITQLNRLLAESSAMQSAAVEWIETGYEDIVAFIKKSGNGDLAFYGNFGRQTLQPDLPFAHSETLLQNLAVQDGQKLTLQAYGYILMEV